MRTHVTEQSHRDILNGHKMNVGVVKSCDGLDVVDSTAAAMQSGYSEWVDGEGGLK